MKKYISLVIVLTVLCGIVTATAIPTFAESGNNNIDSAKEDSYTIGTSGDSIEGYKIIPSYPLSDFISGLNPEDYSGIYMVGDTYYISTNSANINRLVARSSYDEPIVIIPGQEYTLKQLKDYQHMLREHMSRMSLTGSYLDETTNELVVCAEMWTESKKQAVIELLGFDKIRFEIMEPMKSTSAPILGTEISRSGGIRSLGACAVWNVSGERKFGWITAGHYTSKNEKFYYNGTELGKVYDQRSSGNIDAALLQNSGNFQYGLTLPDGNKIEYSSNPAKDQTVTVYGGTSGKHSGRITTITGESEIDGKYTLTNQIWANISGCQQGDSGSPVVREVNGKYHLVGIQNSIGNTVIGAGNISYIKSYWDLNLLSS